MDRNNAERLLDYIDQRIRDLVEQDKPRPFGWQSGETMSDRLREPLIDLLAEED